MLSTVKHFAFIAPECQQIANIGGMRNKEIRLERLKMLVAELGGVQQLATASGVSAEYLQQILDRVPAPKGGPARNLGDRNAKKLEDGCDKPAGWLDLPFKEAEEIPDLAREEISALYSRLPDSARAFALSLLRVVETYASSSGKSDEGYITTEWKKSRARNRTAPKAGNARVEDVG